MAFETMELNELMKKISEDKVIKGTKGYAL